MLMNIHTRRHRINLRLNDAEMALLNAIQTEHHTSWHHVDAAEALRIALRKATESLPVQKVLGLAAKTLTKAAKSNGSRKPGKSRPFARQ